MKKHRFMLAFVFTVLLIFSLAACGQGGGKTGTESGTEPKQTPPNQTQPNPIQEDIKKIVDYKGGPAELLVYDHNSGTTDEQFQSFFIEPLQVKYPQITMTITRESLDKLISAGTTPDIVLVSNAGLSTILEADLPEDLTQMIKEYNIDVSQMNQVVIEQIRNLGDQGAFYGLPFAMNYGAMVYNKDIFDKFGYDYPGEVMNYDEAIEFGRKLTRPDSGTNYIGIMPPDLRQMYWQAGIPVFNHATGKALLTTDAHAEVFSLLNQFYSIPGYVEGSTFRYGVDVFFKEQRMAMYPNWVAAMITFFTNAGTKDEFNWDVTAHPTYKNSPTSGKEVDFHMAVVNKAGKNKEAVYQVLMSLLTEEVQTKYSKAGRVTVLNNSEIQRMFGEESQVFAGKNLQSIFKVTPSPLPAASKYDAKINALLLGETSQGVVLHGTDINTALRTTEEKANKEIIEIDQ